MTVPIQASILDQADEIGLGPLGTVERTQLGDGAWVDLLPNWVACAQELFESLYRAVPWHAERRRMYDSMVDVPRLLAFYDEHDPMPHPVLERARAQLTAYYARDLGEPLCTAGLCLYRDGGDSVAWHGDTVGRGAQEDTVVAIVALGAQRPFLLRPRGGGSSLRYAIGHGDLLVMGGSCQRTWEHAVPKTSKRVGPRISIQFRPRDVR
ncbi:alpha-ketoglutarate-dependent dioxygenase AlkB [Haloechinothrix sp. YIM 98757]|uniref:Alpha-ketoglutarate-dependent dioxygenase AlkB n=1 Tax=Haloechinothrix aidingensis TaxID=2752311 RepID=A0A838A7T8_9PSEU|nr:alpha-ketoglutarate-dependent dioxygenase AlkB [Haloechinothrix aidingensis]